MAGSALRELEAAAGLHAAVLLALHDAAVAGEEAALLEDAAQLRLEVGERLGDAVAHRTGLAGEAAAGDRRHHVELVGAIGGVERLAQGDLEEIQLDTGEIFVAPAGALEQPLPRVSNRLLILSPFDNSVIQRDRLKALFDYDYQIECYVPEPKRQYGYFCLPLMYRDQFIGRMDCKAHRKERCLEIKSLFLEPHDYDENALVQAFTAAMMQFCRFQKCDSVVVSRVQPAHLLERLRTELKFLR